MKILDNVSIFILAGGRGKRFWPLSRENKPKQFLPIFNGKSMLQMTYRRFKKVVPSENINLITTLEQKKSIKKQLPDIKEKNFIIEPEPKGTAAAIGLGALAVKKTDPNAIMVIVPADQFIKGAAEFNKTITTAIKAAKSGSSLVTIGIKPNFAATGYGYLKFSKRIKIDGGFIYKVEKFIEKPPRRMAQRYFKSKEYYFNSGIFIWKASAFLDELKIYLPKLHKKLRQIANKGIKFYKEKDIKSIASIYAGIKPISVDYGLMQKTKNIKAAKGIFIWSDLGNLRCFEEIISKSKGSNIIINSPTMTKKTNNCIIYGKKYHLIATIGLSNLIIIETPDVTLLVNKDNIQEVKDVVDKISKDKKMRRFV